ncbi:MAG: hypothetical protein EBE86_021765 [Hormoscilla sp. GUM202]|nr:hypothetical protein [Hormoscilla sp. GM7CHS1pb]MBO1349835.1 hypothetical protein [Hormoscilla sp. GUM202]
MGRAKVEQFLEKLNEINTRLYRLDKSVEHLDRLVSEARRKTGDRVQKWQA